MEIPKYIKDINNFVQISKSEDVYKVREKSTDEIFEAIPINIKDPNDYHEKKYILQYLDCLQRFDNPAIIKFCGFSLKDFKNLDFPLLFTKYMENGRLRTLFENIVKGSTPKGWNNTKMLINIIGISLGMEYLHNDRNAIHNNLSPSSILLDSEFYPKITNIQPYSHDFDLINAVHREIIYYSPEIFEGEAEFSNKPDIYSFSMILYEFYTGIRPTVSGKSPFQISKSISRGMRPDTSKLNDKPIKDLIEKCWAQDPNERPAFDEIVHLFIDDKNLWPDDVDEDEVQEYLKKFGLSLPNRKKEEKESKDQLESLRQKYEAKLKEQAEKFKKKIKNLKQKEEEQENKIKELQAQIDDLHSKQKKKNAETPQNGLNILDEEIIESLEKVEEIGFGGGGKVFKVKKPEIYALKEMKIQNATIENLKHFLGEYEIMNMLNHPNILKTFGILLSSEKIPPSILLEYCNINLETAILKKQLSNEQIAIAIYQIAEGMKYVHFKNIIHRDLKPTNILIASDGTLKICDFGISKLMSVEEQSMTRGIGTQKFMAPEIINEEEKYDQKVDVYSFGVLVFFILSGGEIPKIKMFDILKGKKADIPDNFTELSKNLITRCWNFKPNDRPSFKEIVDLLDENQYKLIELKNNELEFVKSFVKAHKEKLPVY